LENDWKSTTWLPDLEGVEIWLHRSGRKIFFFEGPVPDFAPGTEHRLRWLRLAIPYAAALQNRPILHAAAVRICDSGIALIGETGSGKSTLARQLRSMGCQMISDDLLPCWLKNSKISIPLNDGYDLPIQAIFFITRKCDLQEPTQKLLSRREHLLGHIRHGFGEIAEPEIWKNQFELYFQMAASIPGYELEIPDNLALLPSSAKWLLDRIRKMK
jgi:hypothetical protein